MNNALCYLKTLYKICNWLLVLEVNWMDRIVQIEWTKSIPKIELNRLNRCSKQTNWKQTKKIRKIKLIDKLRKIEKMMFLTFWSI